MSVSNPNDQRCIVAPMKLRCFTCLSLDRELKPIKENNILALLCPELFLKATFSFMTAQMVCWECSAMIVKIKEFTSKVTKAQAILELSSKKGYYFCEDLSTLKTTTVETINISPEPSIPLPEVIDEPTEQKENELQIEKNEPLSEDDDPLCNEDKLLYEEEKSFNTVEVKKEKRETFSGDDDELIQPMTLQQTDTDPLLIVRAQPIPQKNVDRDMDVTLNYNPQNDFNNTPIPQITVLRVSVGVSNLVKRTKDVPTSVQGKESVPTIIQKHVPVSIAPKFTASAVKSTNEVQQGIYGFDYGEIKCKILNTAEIQIYMDTKRNEPIFKKTRYKCIKCIERFGVKENLDIHNKKHDVSAGNVVCDICDQRFFLKDELDEHFKMHFIIHECLTCGFQNNNRSKISEHIRRKHKLSKECKKCKSIFETHKDLKRHRLTVHSEKPACKECGKIFSSHYILKTHETFFHNNERVTCTICEKKISPHRLKFHMKSHEDSLEDKFYCAECNIYLKTKYSYSVHLKNNLKHNPVEKVRFKCDTCGKLVASKTRLSDHIELEHNGNQSKYTCKVCKNVYKSKLGLKNHIQYQHEGKERKETKTVICEICGKAFKNKTHLACHIDSHYGRRPFKCQDCGNTFTYKAALWTHRKLVHKVKKITEMKKAEMKSEVKK